MISLRNSNQLFKITFYLMALLVLYGTIMPLDNLGSSLGLSFLPFQDKIAHVLMFVVLGFLIVPSYAKTNIIFLGIILSIYGFLIEILQYYFPTGRTFEFLDWVADTLGAFLGIGIYNFFYSKLMSKNK